MSFSVSSFCYRQIRFGKAIVRSQMRSLGHRLLDEIDGLGDQYIKYANFTVFEILSPQTIALLVIGEIVGHAFQFSNGTFKGFF